MLDTAQQTRGSFGAWLASTEVRRRSSVLICRRRLFSASTFMRRCRASVPVTRQPSSATACANVLGSETRGRPPVSQAVLHVRGELEARAVLPQAYAGYTCLVRRRVLSR